MDGGTVWNVNPNDAIQQCLEIVDDIRDVIVDVMICSPHEPPGEESADSDNAVYNLMRSNNIREFDTNANSISTAKLEYPDADWRYLFTQKDPITVCLDFRNETTWPL